MTTELIPSTYEGFLRELKDRVRKAQLQAALSVNNRLVLLYWRIGIGESAVTSLAGNKKRVGVPTWWHDWLATSVVLSRR